MAKEVLQRKAFTISRLAEFVSESELVKQIGHPVADWPLVILKEGVDNALDEAEEAGVPPVIEITVGAIEGAGFDHRPRRGPRHSGRDGREADRLFRPHIEPSGLCVADPWRAGQCAADHHRHALRARRRGLRDGGDREPRRRASHCLRHRSDPPDAQAGDRAARLSGKKRDPADGPVAGFSKLNSGPGQARFLTTRRDLHLAQPAFEPVPDLERRAACSRPMRPCRTGHAGGRARRPPPTGTTPKPCSA